MKRITSILLLSAVFTALSVVTAFAAGNNALTITTDKETVAANETVTVTVTATGDFLGVANVSTSVAFDTDKFDIDANATDWSDDLDSDYNTCLDIDWLDSVHNDKKNSLGRLAAPPSVVGENPDGQLNVVFTKGSGLTSSNSNLVTNRSVVTLKAVFTAKTDVSKIDASCFSLVEGVCKIEDESKVLHTLTYNQIKSASNAINDLSDANAEVKAMFENMFYVVGAPVPVTSTEHYLYAELDGVYSYTASKIGEYIDASGDGVTASVVPVLVVDTADKAAKTYNFGTSATKN